MTYKVYRDSSRSIDERVENLLMWMSLDEKLAQLGCTWITSLMDKDGFSPSQARILAPHGIGEVTRISGATALQPKQSALVMNEVQRYMVEGTRLGIPVLVHEEGTGGFLARGATVFPQALGLASSFDPDLVEEVAGIIRDQMRAVGARHCLAPVLDVARDPRWGRVEETFGEDPYLTGMLGTAYVRGLQTEDLKKGVLATGKHFIGHGLPEGGRNHAPVQLGPRELRDVYAEPFAMAISQAQLGSVMNSYSSVDGLACAGARSILDDLLRKELGFVGMVVADYFSLALLITHHRVASDKQEAAVQALSAGMDLELPETSCFGKPLRDAVEAGRISLETVDTAVRRVLRAKIGLGLFEKPYVEEDNAQAKFDTPAHRALARKAASASIVMLANDGVLPLSMEARRIAVIGPCADDRRVLQGDYHYPAHQEIAYAPSEDDEGSTVWNAGGDLSLLPRSLGEWQPGPYFTEHVTPLQGIRLTVGPATEVVHARGCEITESDESGIEEAVALARSAEVALVFVGGRSGLSRTCTVGEARDAAMLELTGVQEKLVERIAATGVPTVVVVISGRVHALAGVAANARALVQAWPLGEEGGRALADVLFGHVNPSGKLPVSMPRSVGQVPRYMGHRAGGSTAMFYGAYIDSPTTPLFSFGHGLSYTQFEYSNLVVEAESTANPVRVLATLTNVGDRFGEEVVQCYASDLVASVARPDQQLVGFARVPLGAGESSKVEFEIPSCRLAFTNEHLRRVTEPGAFRIAIGGSAADLPLCTTVTLDGEVVEHGRGVHSPTRVTLARQVAVEH